MIKKTTLAFLEKLKLHNNQDWFKAHKPEFDQAQADFESLLDKLALRISKFDETIARNIDGSKHVFRIYRDMRFSKDRSPYKTHFGGIVSPEGKAHTAAVYYLHIQPGGKSGFGGGVHQPETKDLTKIRQEIADNAYRIHKIIEERSFKKLFGGLEDHHVQKLKTVPRGFPKDHPEAGLLKLKGYFTWHGFSDKDVTSKGFLTKVVAAARANLPLNRYLNNILKQD